MLICGSNAKSLISQSRWLWPAFISPLVNIKERLRKDYENNCSSCCCKFYSEPTNWHLVFLLQDNLGTVKGRFSLSHKLCPQFCPDIITGPLTSRLDHWGMHQPQGFCIPLDERNRLVTESLNHVHVNWVLIWMEDANCKIIMALLSLKAVKHENIKLGKNSRDSVGDKAEIINVYI